MPNCKYLIKSNPDIQFLSHDKALVAVKLVACDGREKEFTMPVATTDGSVITEALIYEQIQEETRNFDRQTPISLPTLNLTKDVLIDVLSE